MIQAALFVMSAGAQESYDFCVDRSQLSPVDPNQDGVLTAAELQEAAGQHPDNKELQDLVAEAEDRGSIGARYDGQCDEGGSGAMGTPAPGELCSPNPQLALIDANDDGVISIVEIDRLIELAGGNEQLEDLRDKAVEDGIVGIRYRDCDPGTPAASPVSTPTHATPTATPDTAALDGDNVESDATSGGSMSRPVVFALAGGSVLLLGGFLMRVLRKS